MIKEADIVENTEMLPMLEELVVLDTPSPTDNLVITEEPAAEEEKEFDVKKNKDFKKFLPYLKKLIAKIPSHSGKTTAGCERAIAHLAAADRLISQVIADDVDCEIDDQAVEAIRKEIRKMTRMLKKRHKEINEVYDADDEKYASVDNEIVKSAEDKKWVCTKCDPKKDFNDEEHLTRHMATEHGVVGSICECELTKLAAGLHCKKCGVQVADQKAAKVHAEINHKGEDVGFTDYDETKKGSVLVDENCPTCKIKLWKAEEGLYECIACDEVFERQITKEAGSPKIQLVMSAFERAITGAIINGMVSNGKNAGKVYFELKEKYKISDREELSIIQILKDMGYPLQIDRGTIGNKNNLQIEFATNYQA